MGGLVVAVFLGGGLFSFTSTAAVENRPNILFIMADDMGYGDLQSYGHPRIKTPHLDQLAVEGTRFTQYYQGHSVCSPSRVSLLTGHYPSRWNIYAHIAWLRSNAQRGMPDWLSSEAPSMPRMLQDAGYRTAHFGKWHLGGGSGRIFRGKAINSADAPDVSAYGFDATRVFVGNGPTWLGTELREEAHDLYPLSDDVFLTQSSRLIVDAAIGFLDDHARESSTKPFMMNVWFHDPHVPLRPTREMELPYADVADPVARAYYAVVTNMDRHVGRLLAHLDALGLRENTLVVFTSDNGTPYPVHTVNAAGETELDAHGWVGFADTQGSNGPLRGWKWHLYDGGVRVPLIVRWPGEVPAGRVDTQSVLHGTDFMPTFSRLAKADLPPDYQADGVNIARALVGKPFFREQPIFWHHPTDNRRGPTVAIRDGDWKLLMERDGSEAHLYNLSRDESERTDVAREFPAVVETLRGKLKHWQKSLPPPLDRDYLEPGGPK